MDAHSAVLLCAARQVYLRCSRAFDLLDSLSAVCSFKLLETTIEKLISKKSNSFLVGELIDFYTSFWQLRT